VILKGSTIFKVLTQLRERARAQLTSHPPTTSPRAMQLLIPGHCKSQLLTAPTLSMNCTSDTKQPGMMKHPSKLLVPLILEPTMITTMNIIAHPLRRSTKSHQLALPTENMSTTPTMGADPALPSSSNIPPPPTMGANPALMCPTNTQPPPPVSWNPALL
jgi:hypothetical protein